LIKQNKDSIDKLLASFRTDLNKVQDEFEECKRTANGLRVYYDGKLEVLDTEHNDEVDLIKMKHKDQVDLLDKQQKELEVEQFIQKEKKDELE